jgi:hypothetical protein
MKYLNQGVIMSDELKMIEDANTAIADFLRVDARNVKDAEFGRLQAKANVGIKVRHDQKVEERENRNQVLRAISMAFNDPKIREQYIKASAPKMLPDLKVAS